MRIAPLEFEQKKLSLTGLLLILSLILGSPLLAQDTPDKKLEEIRTQIHILNLLNGLELNKEQMQLVLDAARQAERIRNKTKELLWQKEDEINQTYALDDYKPCIIPPVKQGRIGQADDPSGFAKVLERVYSMPQNSYDLKKDGIAKKTIDRMKAKAPPAFIIEEDKLKTQLLKTMDEARAMSNIDFNLKKEALAQNIKAQLLPKKPPINIGVKIERFLLQPEIISILEQRLTQYAS